MQNLKNNLLKEIFKFEYPKINCCSTYENHDGINHDLIAKLYTNSFDKNALTNVSAIFLSLQIRNQERDLSQLSLQALQEFYSLSELYI